MGCELCGKEEVLVKARVEGSVMHVCKGCASYGEVIEEPRRQVKKALQFEEPTELIVSDYSERVKKAREERGMKQEALAKKIGERVSLLSHIESGKTEPSFATAKKLERTLGISLREVEIPQHVERKKGAEGLTIGDMLKK